MWQNTRTNRRNVARQKVDDTVTSFVELAECHCRLCDNWNEASFQVHMEVGMMKVKQSKEGLHHHKFSPAFITTSQFKETQPLGTADENAAGHTNQQCEQEKGAQKLHHIIGHQQ